MPLFTKALGAGAAALCVTAAAGQVAPTPIVETIAQYPHGQFLENNATAADGALLITSYVDRTILRWSGAGQPEPLSRLDVHPVGIVATGNRIVISAHGASFLEGPAFVRTNQMLVLDSAGRVVQRTAVPDARFLNGLVDLGADHVLVADSLAGVIWLYRPSTGAISEWLRAPELATDPSATDPRPGANGLKLRGDWLYVSNSSRGTIYRIRVADRTPEGALSVFARTGPVDDFAFMPDGTIAATTHGARLIRVDPSGTVSSLLASGCDACTSVASLADGDLIVTTSGNLLEGGDAPARLLRVKPVVR